MRSTFMGLETSRSGLFTQQSALYTTGHNIANANTEGYSRQRVNMQATPGFPTAGLNTPNYPGHMGTGVEAGSIQRIRNEFIDRQYRQETNRLGYWESRSNAISQMEDIINEPSDYGLDKALQQFWGGLQDVSTGADNAASRRVAIERGNHLAESFNYIHTQLKTIQGNLGNEISVTTNRINALLNQIASINKRVQEVEPNGHVPNDLYDARDVLIDELNKYIPVSIERVPSGGFASSVAEGSLTIIFKPFGTNNAIKLVNGQDAATIAVNSGTTQIDGTNVSNLFTSIEVTGTGTADTGTITYNELEPGKGKLLSLINTYGYRDGQDAKGYYPETLANLDKLASEFANVFNTMHKQGFDLTGAQSTIDFFVPIDNAQPISAGNMKVNEELLKDSSKLAASSRANEEGNGEWALALSNIQSQVQANLNGATFNSYYQGMTGKLGVDGEEASRLNKTSETLLVTIGNNRSSNSSVSLDEEMTNMITFQQAYNANARMITAIDETLDKIINGMGRVGI